MLQWPSTKASTNTKHQNYKLPGFHNTAWKLRIWTRISMLLTELNPPLLRSSGTFSSPLSFRPVGIKKNTEQQSAQTKCPNNGQAVNEECLWIRWKPEWGELKRLNLTSHPYTPDRTNSDASRHLSRDNSQHRKHRGIIARTRAARDLRRTWEMRDERFSIL